VRESESKAETAVLLREISKRSITDDWKEEANISMFRSQHGQGKENGP
jgi:hypothetical protein